MKKIIILSGPSCTGKSPLLKALYLHFQEMMEPIKTLVLYNSRAKRPMEKEGMDYYFRSKSEMKKLQEKPQYIVLNVRNDIQVIDLIELRANLEKHTIIFEGSTMTGLALLNHPSLQKEEILSVFISPFSEIELNSLSDENIKMDFIRNRMMDKLIHRTILQKGEISEKELTDLSIRAESAFHEIKNRHHFSHIVVNHDGEGHKNWLSKNFPEGDAGRAVSEVAQLIKDFMTK